MNNIKIFLEQQQDELGWSIVFDRIAGNHLKSTPHTVPVWWNWQTRRTQNPVPAREWEFDSPHRHHIFQWVMPCSTITVLCRAAKQR
jgi:hypothetical protein